MYRAYSDNKYYAVIHCNLSCLFLFLSIKTKNVGVALSSRAAARQVFSALKSLTTVFGMGTGGPSSLSTPTLFGIRCFPYFFLFGDP